MRAESMLKRRALPVLLAALVAVCAFWGFFCRAEGELYASEQTDVDMPTEAREKSASPVTIFLNSHEREPVYAGDSVSYRFMPAQDDTYIFRSFSFSTWLVPETEVRLIREGNDEEILSSSQEGCYHLEADLKANESYRLDIEVKSDGLLITEVMQEIHGRCMDDPIALPGTSVRYAKTIVRARDTHWYSFTAPVSGWYSLRTEQDGAQMDTHGYLMDAKGTVIAANDDMLFPGNTNFLIQCELTAEETYFLRVSAFSNETGPYQVVLTAPEEGRQPPRLVTLSEHALMMDVDGEFQLQAALMPADSLAELIYVSSDSSIVHVDAEGKLHARAAGEAYVYALSYNGVRDRCLITVRPVEVTGMRFEREWISLHQGETVALTPLFEPENATLQSVDYFSSDESILTVDEKGIVAGISPGEAIVTAISQDGSFVASVRVTVETVRPVYRALVIGEQDYEDGTRLGGRNTAQGVADMLSGQTIEGYGYDVRLQLDSTLSEFMEGIELAFAGAAESDISLIYINCHGGYEDGEAFLRLHDESRITDVQLEQMLRAVPGRIVLILDFCQSGAFIAHGGEEAHSVFTADKYAVLASASIGEDSYRRSFLRDDSEESTAAIMGRSLCEGAGWDLIYDRSVSLKADQNGDREITLQELYEYTSQRVSEYLEGTGAVQTVCMEPDEEQAVMQLAILGRS